MSVAEPKLNRLTPKQEAAIPALLNTPTIGEAAALIGVTDRTLFRWLQTPEFQEAYRQARREVVSHATTRLQQAASKAVDTLEDVMDDSAATPASRVSAARAVLELAFRAVEVEDLTARIEALEERHGT